MRLEENRGQKKDDRKVEREKEGKREEEED